MQYYVCRNPEPMDVPWGVGGVRFYSTETEAREAAVSFAEETPGFAYYVHAFTASHVLFRAEGVVDIRTEWMDERPQQG